MFCACSSMSLAIKRWMGNTGIEGAEISKLLLFMTQPLPVQELASLPYASAIPNGPVNLHLCRNGIVHAARLNVHRVFCIGYYRRCADWRWNAPPGTWRSALHTNGSASQAFSIATRYCATRDGR